MDNNYDNEQRAKQLSLNFDSIENKIYCAPVIDLNFARQKLRLSQNSTCKKGVAISALLKEAQSLTW